MPSYGLLGTNGPGVYTGIRSADFAFPGGPYPGFIDQTFTMIFTGIPYIGIPNVVATTGNPHWTVHPIWVNLNGAGFVINRKTPSPGGQMCMVYAMAMGPMPPVPTKSDEKLEAEIKPVSMEEFVKLARENGVEYTPSEEN